MERTVKGLLVSMSVAAIVAFCLAPSVYMVLTSLSAGADYLGSGGDMVFSLEHYHSLLTSESTYFSTYLKNSLIVSALSAAICVAVAAPAAYAITRLPLPGKATILMTVLAMSMFPQISIISYLFDVMSAAGLTNTYHALLWPYVAWSLPLALWILTSYFAKIPRELDQAALVDGCTRWQILRRVILPLSAPGIVSTFILSFIWAFNEFMFALMLTTDHSARTIPVAIAQFQGLHGETPWGEVMAASTLTIIPAVLLTLVFQRRIIHGLTRGAIKG